MCVLKCIDINEEETKMAKGSVGKNWKHFDSLIGVKMQKKERPQIETIIELLINDLVIKENLSRVVGLLKENNAKPAWFTTSHYKFKHNGQISFQIKLGDGFKFRENEVHITVHTTTYANIIQFKQAISEEMSKLIPVNSDKFKVCGGCSGDKPCKNRADFIFEGKEYKNICAKNIEVRFSIDSNTVNLAEQFKMIEDFIKAKIAFNNITHT